VGAGLKSLVDVVQAISSGAIATSDLILFPIGLIAAAISGYLAVRFLMRYVQNHSTDVFVYYRWGLGVLIILVALLRP
jgi:undecaprenyl-diphosphatase